MLLLVHAIQIVALPSIFSLIICVYHITFSFVCACSEDVSDAHIDEMLHQMDTNGDNVVGLA